MFYHSHLFYVLKCYTAIPQLLWYAARILRYCTRQNYTVAMFSSVLHNIIYPATDDQLRHSFYQFFKNFQNANYWRSRIALFWGFCSLHPHTQFPSMALWETPGYQIHYCVCVLSFMPQIVQSISWFHVWIPIFVGVCYTGEGTCRCLELLCHRIIAD